jgi:hypothetical protein
VLLKKLESFTVNKTLLAITSMNLGKVVCFAYSDSSVEYRDRTTMLETFNDGDIDKVWHLSQIGFSYTEDEPCKVQSCFWSTFLTYRRLAGRLVSELLFHGAASE